MDSRENKGSDDSGLKPDTSHLNTRVVTGKKSSKSVLVWVVVLVVIVVAAVAGYYFYKTNVIDKQDNNGSANNVSQSPSPTPKKLTSEEQMSAALEDGVKKQIAELSKDDEAAKEAIRKSTQAAASVGIGDENMKELERIRDEEEK